MTVDFLPLADEPAANVVTQVAYAALLAGAMAPGYSSGIVPSNVFNKTLRQSSKMAAAIAQAMSTLTGQDVLDTDANTAALAAQFILALQASSKSVIVTGATFDAGVANGNAVYWNAAGPNWKKALADGTTTDLGIGFADVTNSKVYLFGLFPGLLAGLTPGARYYLSGSVAGAITVTAPADVVYVGIAKSATDLFVDFETVPAQPMTVGLTSGHKNLKIAAQGINNHNAIITADDVTLRNTSAGSFFTALAVNVTVDTSASGANGLDTGALAINTWYNLYVIYNPSTATTAGLASLSATAPTLPSGYTFRARVGAVLTDASGSKYLMNTLQLSGEATYTPLAGSNTAAIPTMISGASGSPTVPTWTAVPVAAFVPPTARSIIASPQNQVGSPGITLLSPNNTAGAYGSTTNPPKLQAGGGNALSVNAYGNFLLESTNVYYACSGTGAAFCYGWIDNLN